METGFSLIDFDASFPMQSSEFIKPLNFESNLKKKNCKKNPKIFIFNLKMEFYR